MNNIKCGDISFGIELGKRIFSINCSLCACVCYSLSSFSGHMRYQHENFLECSMDEQQREIEALQQAEEANKDKEIMNNLAENRAMRESSTGFVSKLGHLEQNIIEEEEIEEQAEEASTLNYRENAGAEGRVKQQQEEVEFCKFASKFSLFLLLQNGNRNSAADNTDSYQDEADHLSCMNRAVQADCEECQAFEEEADECWQLTEEGEEECDMELLRQLTSDSQAHIAVSNVVISNSEQCGNVENNETEVCAYNNAI